MAFGLPLDSFPFNSLDFPVREISGLRQACKGLCATCVVSVESQVLLSERNMYHLLL